MQWQPASLNSSLISCSTETGNEIRRSAAYHVSRSLVELAGQLSIADVELDEGMAWGQGHLRKVWNGNSGSRATIVQSDDSSTVWKQW